MTAAGFPLRGVRLHPRRNGAGPLRGPVGGQDGLLIVGHGSACSVSAEEMDHIAALVSRERPDLVVGLGYLELCEPPAGRILDALVESGCRRITVMPLQLFAAGHAKNDVPAIVLEGRARHPGVELGFAGPLGVSRALVAMAGERLGAAGADGLPLLVIARGTSDPDANSEAYRAARLTAEWSGAPSVHTAFTGVTWPRVPHVLSDMERLGIDRAAVLFWFLCHGKLIERAREEIAGHRATTGADLVDAGYFGPDPALAGLVLERRDESLSGVANQNCDTCGYRAPFPGLDDRVGQPLGVGHSHLAVEHRGHHHHH